ncbi:MAG TPA: flagellar export chaperone FliS [Candidatus Acidoferrum sp.]|jgi:flagellar protein FliS
MSDNKAASIYQQASAHGRSPVGIIVLLYDTILRDFRRALAAMKTGDIEIRVMELNHALTVIAHLQGVLNHEKGQDAARGLQRFYQVTRALVLNANVRGSKESVEQLIELYRGLRAAWHQAEQSLLGTDASASPGNATGGPEGLGTSIGRGDSSLNPRTNWSA